MASSFLIRMTEIMNPILQLGNCIYLAIFAILHIDIAMKDYKLGEFEEIVLLTVAQLHNDAYGVSIKDTIQAQAKRSVSVGALQSALRRMEKKGYLTSKRGEPNAQRGGKPKLYFSITAYGLKALQHAKDLRNELWNAIPEAAHNVSFAW